MTKNTIVSTRRNPNRKSTQHGACPRKESEMTKKKTMKKWLTTTDGKTPLEVLESALDKVQFVVSNLDIVSLEDVAEHLETLLEAMQIDAGKKKSKSTAGDVASALIDLRFLDDEGVFNGLNESMREALAVAEEWQSFYILDDEDVDD